MAEGVGFEPTAQGFAPRTAFPVPHLRPLGHPSSEKMAEGRGFEPPRDLLGPYPISSRTPSTGLGHPSANPVRWVTIVVSFQRTRAQARRPRRPARHPPPRRDG